MKKIVAWILAASMILPGQAASLNASAAETGTEQRAAKEVSIPEARIMDVDFTSGDATDQSELQNTYEVVGSPTVAYNEELKKQVANFDGGSAYLYPFDEEKYEKITEEVTIECMFRYNSTPWEEREIFSNQQYGGIGLGVKDGRLILFAHVGGSYREPSAVLQPGQWVHAVGVADGHSVKLYVNGVLKEEIAAEGTVSYPSEEGARNFIIGGDSNSYDGAEAFMDGSVSVARIYDRALTEEEIGLLSTQAFENTQIQRPQVRLGLVASDTAPEQGEMNVNLHVNKDALSVADAIACTLKYDSDMLSYSGIQHSVDGLSVDDSEAGILRVSYEGDLSESDFGQYGETRLGKLNFKTTDVEGVQDTKITVDEIHAYASDEEITDQLDAVEAEKTISIYDKNSLDLNEDGVIGAGDVALAQDEEQRKAIAQKAAIYPYKHVVVLTVDGSGVPWEPDQMYYAASNNDTPRKTSDPSVLEKRNNPYALWLFNEEFATSYTAQAVEPSISAQNYTSIIHGVPWQDFESEYQVTNESSEVEYYPDFGKETAKYPSMFKAVADAAPERKIAAFTEWANILNGIIEPDAAVIGKASGEKQSFYDVADYIKSDQYQNTALIYMQSDWMDHVGHGSGYYNDNFWSELAQYDDFYQAVVDALKETGTYEETLIISNADHGGSGYNHGSTDPSNMDVFIGLGGQTVDSGRRLNGGDNADIAALALAGLRIDKPESMTGQVFDENIFLSQEEMSKKNRDIEKVTFQRLGNQAALSLSNQKSQTRVMDVVINLGDATVEEIQAEGGTILRQSVENGQLKLTIYYENQPKELAKLTFAGDSYGDIEVEEVMLGTAEGKEIYADLEESKPFIDKIELVKDGANTLRAEYELQNDDGSAQVKLQWYRMAEGDPEGKVQLLEETGEVLDLNGLEANRVYCVATLIREGREDQTIKSNEVLVGEKAFTYYDITDDSDLFTFEGEWGTDYKTDRDVYWTENAYEKTVTYLLDRENTASISFTFQGKGIRWIGAKEDNQGIAEVVVDEGTPEEVDLYTPDASTGSQVSEVLFEKTWNEVGEHTITIRRTGKKNEMSEGRTISLDAFLVITEDPDQEPDDGDLEEAIRRAEEARKKAEAAQAAAEAAKEDALQAKKEAEAMKDAAQTAAQEAEAAKATAEEAKRQAGEESAEAKAALAAAEKKAQEAEAAQKAAEEAKKAAQEAQTEAETAKAQAERILEQARVLAEEAERKVREAEEAKAQSEAERLAAEAAKRQAEAERLAAEAAKKEAQAEQEAARLAREAAEEAQKAAEEAAKAAKEALEEWHKKQAEGEKEPEVQVKKTAIKSVKSKKKRELLVSWKKQKDVSGYEIQYSRSRTFKNADVKKVGAKKKSVKLRKLAGKKTYYVRIRAYKKTSDGTVYGAYSKTAKCKIK